jgi:DNA-binding transcriptional regulator LsrR (DeoR family)
MMPAERVAMRQVREIIRLKFSAGISTREIARRLGIAASFRLSGHLSSLSSVC